MLRRLSKLFLRINPAEVTFSRRGFFYVNDLPRHHLEEIGRSFLYGYHAAIDYNESSAIVAEIESLPLELRGFGFEGAAMSMALLDNLSPWKHSRWAKLLEGPGATHCYMMHVGYGWAIARVPWLRCTLKKQLRSFDPLLKWLVLDGFGFHEGYFHWGKRKKWGESQPFSGYLGRAFDQGLGRSLWFVCGSDVHKLQQVLTDFSRLRQPDLWSGVGLAAMYAGEVSDDELTILVESSGAYRNHLAQGAAFAAEARTLAGNPTDYSERACEYLCGRSVLDAALLTREARDGLGDMRESEEVPVYETWRTVVRNRLEEQAVCRN